MKSKPNLKPFTSKENKLTQTKPLLPTVKNLIDFLKSNFDLDFNKLSPNRFRDRAEKACENEDYSNSHKLDMTADVKEILSDYELNYEERKFRITTLIELILKTK